MKSALSLMTLLFAGALIGTLVVEAVARRGRAVAAVVSYSLPLFVTTVGGAAVAVDLVDVFTTAFALVFAFFGGIVNVFCADVRACERMDVAKASRAMNVASRKS
jgi:cytochrome c biogenesis protein ResB